MTVMPDHTARLSETAHLVVLDPALGPVERQVCALALGDEVLAVANGRMCFRRVMASAEAPPPPAVILLVDALAHDMPRRSLPLDRRQPVGLAQFPADLKAVVTERAIVAHQATGYWVELLVEGAERIIVENIAIGTGPLADDFGLDLQASDATPDVPLPLEAVAPLHAFNGPQEIELAGFMPDELTSVVRFLLPPRTTTVRLSSVSTQPPGDGRRLGMAIFRLMIDVTDIPLDSPALVRGFHRAESGEGRTWRWTDGDALLILPPKAIPQTLSVHLVNWHRMLHADIG